MNRESFCGFHYISTFYSCLRKFFFKYVLKWVPDFTSPALSEGAAIHEGIATFYQTGSVEKALQSAADAIAERRPFYEDDEKWKDGYVRVMLIVEGWLKEWETLTNVKYKVLHVEEPREVLIPGSNYIMTIRPDVELEEISTGEVHVNDTKTSSYSMDSIYEGFTSSQQSTYYLAGLRLLPEYQGKVLSAVPDAIYQRASVVKCERRINVYRSESEIKEFYIEVKAILDDMYDRVHNYQSLCTADWPNPLTLNHFFPRCPTCDGGMAWKCEYKGICRHPATAQIPLGFHFDDRPFTDIVSEAERV